MRGLEVGGKLECLNVSQLQLVYGPKGCTKVVYVEVDTITTKEIVYS